MDEESGESEEEEVTGEGMGRQGETADSHILGAEVATVSHVEL